MVGKRAKVLSPDHVEDLLVFARQTRHPLRNQAMVLLSVKAGLRASEIANLTWSMVIDPTGQVSTCLELQIGLPRRAAGLFHFTPICTRRWSSSPAWNSHPTVRSFDRNAAAR